METSEVHAIISDKYEKLMLHIAHKISGDVATSSVEDNYQDLWLAAFEAIEGFSKQNNCANGPVEKWIRTRSFDKYLKTCLWNKKNHKGKNITLRYNIHRDTVPTHLEEVLNVADKGYTMRPEDYEVPVKRLLLNDHTSTPRDHWAYFGDMGVDLTIGEASLVTTIISDPDRYLSDEGNIKISPVERKLGWGRNCVALCIDNIKKKMNRNLKGSI